MNAVPDAWRHDGLGWFPHAPGVDDEHLTPESPSAVAPRATNAIGIDVSAYQGVVDWAAVAASGRSFVYIKATEGVGYINPDLDAQYQGATAAGLKVGLYAFADTTASATANADFFATQVNRLGAIAGHMPPCLDLETGTGNLSGWAQQFITELRAKTGCVRVMLYSGASFFQNSVGESWMDSNIALWIASWGVSPGQPSYLTPRVALHQFTSTAQVSGVVGTVDADWAIWPLASIIPGAVAPPPVATAPPAPVTSAPVTSLTADQVNQILGFLTALYQQSSGSITLGDWTGWGSWPGGSGRSLTMVDYLRQSDVILNTLIAKANALQAQLAVTPAAGSLSDADVQRIATAVAVTLAQRMAS